MGSYDTEIRVSTKVETSQMQKLQIQIDKTCRKVETLTKEYDELRNKKIPTQGYTDLENKIKSVKFVLNSLLDEQKKLSDKGIGKGFDKEIINSYKMVQQMKSELAGAVENRDQDYYLTIEDSLNRAKAHLQEIMSKEPRPLGELIDYEIIDNKIKSIKEEIAPIEAEMQKLVDTGKAFTFGGNNEEINNKFNELESAKAELRMFITKMDELGVKPTKVSDGLKKIGVAAKRAFGEVNNGVKKSSGLLSTFTSRLKGIALSLLIFNWISKGFNTMISGMKKGFENFMGYSSSYVQSVQDMKNAMSTLGNQFAAAFAPIVQMVIPWLISFINVISKAMTYVAQFIAVLGGKNTFTRAKQIQDSYNKSLGGTASAAKKAAGALAKFDDLDVLQKKEDDSGGGAEGTDPSQMFEEVPVDSKFKSWLDGILEKIKPILEYFEKLKDIFMEGFWDGLGDWEYRLESIKGSLASIKESLIDIFTDPAVLEAADGWAQSVAYMLGSLVGSAASIGLTIATNLLGGIASYLKDNKDRIKDYLVSMFDVQAEVNYMLADFFQSFAYVFEAFASEGGIQLTANLIGIFTDAFMGITELASKFARDVLNIFIQPFVENKEELRTALEGFLGVLAEVTGTIKQGIDDTFDKLNEVYDSHFKPFFDSIATGLSELLAKFLEFWNGKVQPIMDQWAAAFDALWKGHIQPFINSFIDLLGSAADLLKTFWEQGIQPLINWIVENILPVILPILEAIYNTIVTVIGDAADLLSGFANTIKSIIDTVVSLINGDWAGAWESAKGIFENAFNSILAFAQMMWDSFIGVINVALQTIIGAIQVALLGVYDFITGIWNGIYETTSEIWTMVVEWLTENFTSFHDFLTTMLENILLFFTETWENITLVFQTFIDFINETVIPIWQESWNMAGSLFQSFHDLIDRLIKAVKEFLDGLMKSVKLLVNGDWKGAWDTAKEVFSAFQAKVDEIINAVRAILESFFEWVSGMISGVLESISNIGSAVKGAFSGGDFSGKSALTAAAAVPYSFNDMPHLANGTVIRGGNPFMAVLGDQRAGQTNIEAPLSTIRQAVREEMAGMNFGGGNISADMTLDGETVARLLVPYIIDEMGRQGLDVDILGVT